MSHQEKSDHMIFIEKKRVISAGILHDYNAGNLLVIENAAVCSNIK